MGELHVITGGGNAAPPGSVEQMLRQAMQDMNSQNTEFVVIIGLQRAAPGVPLTVRLLYSAADKLKLLGVMHWMASRVDHILNGP